MPTLLSAFPWITQFQSRWRASLSYKIPRLSLSWGSPHSSFFSPHPLPGLLSDRLILIFRSELRLGSPEPPSTAAPSKCLQSAPVASTGHYFVSPDTLREVTLVLGRAVSSPRRPAPSVRPSSF